MHKTTLSKWPASGATHNKPMRMQHSSYVTQMADEVHDFEPQKDLNIYNIAPYNIKLLCVKIENMFIHLMMIILSEVKLG